MSESWKVNPATGDYVMENGSPQPSLELIYPAFTRLTVKRGTWLYAPDDQFGADFFLVKKRSTQGDNGGLLNIARKALQPILDDNRASDVSAEFEDAGAVNRSAIALKIDLLDSQGNVQTLNLPSIGV